MTGLYNSPLFATGNSQGSKINLFALLKQREVIAKLTRIDASVDSLYRLLRHVDDLLEHFHFKMSHRK